MRSWPTVLAAAALAVSLSGSLAACGDDGEEPSADDTATASSSLTHSESHTPAASETATPVEPPSATEEAGTVVVITIEGDRITPAGDRLEVERDEVVTLEITSDRAGELHVHSKPEQYVEFEAGTSTHELVIGAPGVVDVEDHETGHVIVQLEVR
jgi:predicted small lipoprotein YifL